MTLLKVNKHISKLSNVLIHPFIKLEVEEDAGEGFFLDQLKRLRNGCSFLLKNSIKPLE